jgi:hypothetical protein
MVTRYDCLVTVHQRPPFLTNWLAADSVINRDSELTFVDTRL